MYMKDLKMGIIYSDFLVKMAFQMKGVKNSYWDTEYKNYLTENVVSLWERFSFSLSWTGVLQYLHFAINKSWSAQTTWGFISC